MEYDLTYKDRAILIYLFRILLKQGDCEYDYEKMITILQCGYKLEYHEIFNCLSLEELSEKECEEVHNILEMYRGIANSYSSLNKEGKENSLTDDMICFPGFDGNNESKQFSYMHYLLDVLGLYPEIRKSIGDYNSHYPYLDTYRRRCEKWNEYKQQKLDINNLSEGEILDLLGIH